MHYKNYQNILDFLLCPTPYSWIDKALDNQDTLLLDHAHCEKKAASAAMSFMYRKSTEDSYLLRRMSKISREELVHFEQVMTILKQRGIKYKLLSESRYVRSMRKYMRTSEEGRLVDNFIIGAFIEARSCERFGSIAPHLDDDLSKFYQGLLESEKRHFTIYLDFANKYSDNDITPFVDMFANIEQELILSSDYQFRFHSGA